VTSIPTAAQSARHRRAFLSRWSHRPDIVARAHNEAAWHRLRVAGLDPGRLLVGDAKPNRYGAERPTK
jgi:hypothetical protein